MRTGWILLLAALALPGTQPAQAQAQADTTAQGEASSTAAVQGIGEVMALPAELRAELQQRVIGPGKTPRQRMERLVAYVFDEDGLAIGYDNQRTRTVAEAYRDRQANCLSFTLLFVAMAREAGLEAKVQEVGEVLVWYQGDGAVYAANHVNALVRVDSQMQVVDVGSNIVAMRNRPRAISDERAMAHFHNNRGAELMAEGDEVAARASLLAAIGHDPGFPSIWNNYGVLLSRQGDLAGAEQAYLAALRNDPRSAPALGNLASLYERQGDARLQARYERRLDQVRRTDPFRQFALALQCENDGDYACAIDRYRRSIRLQHGEHQFHFGLSRAYFLSGDLAAAQRELTRALALAGSEATRTAYQQKLEALRRWHGQAASQLRH